MPVNLDEVRRAFNSTNNAGTPDGDATGGDATGRGDASDRDGTSVDGVARPDVHAIDGDRTVSPAAAVPRPDDGRRARSGSDRNAGRSATRTGKQSAVTTRPQTTSNLEKLLFTCHAMLAAKTDLASLKIPPAEAQELAASITELNALYGGKGGVLGPKAFAWLNFSIALGGTYVPMVSKVRKEIKQKRGDNGTDIPTGS